MFDETGQTPPPKVDATLISLIRSAPPFASLSHEELLPLMEGFLAVRYARGEVLFRQGEPATHVFLVARGTVKITVRERTGRELLVEVVGRGHFLGDLEAIDGGARSTGALAMEESRLYRASTEHFSSMLMSYPRLAHRLLGLWAVRVRRGDRTRLDLLDLDPNRKLARRLIQLAEDYGRARIGGAIEIETRLTQGDLAQLTGISRGTANRALGKLSDSGVIDWNGGRPVVLKPQELVSLADQDP